MSGSPPSASLADTSIATVSSAMPEVRCTRRLGTGRRFPTVTETVPTPLPPAPSETVGAELSLPWNPFAGVYEHVPVAGAGGGPVARLAGGR